ncbi:MAG TPA: S16 family serine protease [Candidatus Eisenbacteria bacterium]
MELATILQQDRLRYAKVLVEMRDLHRAELEVAAILEEAPEQLDALSLFTKIKHMRGQLSLAVACFAQIQSRRAAWGEQGRMHLESMLHMAQDPVHGAGEFLAMGQFQLVKKPTAYLELEEAFRQFVNRRPTEAGAICRRVAARYKERDVEVYKLAVLAEAWIQELTGQLQQACETLERLGLERGFETDLDRLTTLVTVYEKIGTRSSLGAAVNICRYLLEGADGAFVLGRLAMLHQRLGESEAAAEYEQRHLAAYRRAMHRVSFDDLLAVASRRFLPIERLRQIRVPDVESPPDASRRELAIANAIHGDVAEARRGFSTAPEVLDLKYLANLEAVGNGDAHADRAVEGYAKVLRADPGDLNVIAWLLERQATTPSEPIAAVFREPAVLAEALQALERAVHDDPVDHRLWRQLSVLFGLMNRGADQQRQFADRAAALERRARERREAIGRVQSAATYRFAGVVRGLIHEIWATREMASGQGGTLRRDDILGNLTTEMRDSVRNTFVAVREYAQSMFPHLTRDIMDYNYGYKVTKDDEPSGGTSAGLPTAMAFLSQFLQRPIRQDVALTGLLVADAHDVLTVRTVGDIEQKVDAAYHRNLAMIVVPTGNRPLLEQGSLVPRAIQAEIVRYASDLNEAVRIVFGDTELL